jgi:pyrimidine deaminase RibD-like protein
LTPHGPSISFQAARFLRSRAVLESDQQNAGNLGGKMTPETAYAVMQRTIEVAKRSCPEDDRPHPCVGAILTDVDGNVLSEMARGEFAPGTHAEAGILALADQKGIDLTKAVLFATLEPCTWRSRNHEPCALRVQRAGIPLVFIGMIDPDLRICGRGETFLSFFTRVERFPGNLRMEIAGINESFVAVKRDALIWAVRTYGIDPNSPAIHRPRQSLLHLSQDLIFESEGDVWISGGDLSWLEELQPALLRVHLDGRKVRILCNSNVPDQTEKAAISLGATISIAQKAWPFRGVIVAPATPVSQVLVVDAGDAHKLGCPEDQRLIETLSQGFEERWGDAKDGIFRIEPLSDDDLVSALTKKVSHYSALSPRFEEGLAGADSSRPSPIPF